MVWEHTDISNFHNDVIKLFDVEVVPNQSSSSFSRVRSSSASSSTNVKAFLDLGQRAIRHPRFQRDDDSCVCFVGQCCCDGIFRHARAASRNPQLEDGL